MRDVDRITELLPNHLKVEWRRRYRDTTPAEKIRPFVSFMKFVGNEKEAISRMAEDQPKTRLKKTSHYVLRNITSVRFDLTKREILTILTIQRNNVKNSKSSL